MSIDQAGLKQWVETVTGRSVTEMRRMPGGASRVSLKVDYGTGASSLLRIDTGEGPLSGTSFNLEREHRVLKALSDAHFAVPRILGFSTGHKAILMEYIDSCGNPPLTAAQRKIQQRALLGQIVRLQQLDPAASGLLKQDWPTVGEALEQELATWQQLYRERVAEPQATLEFCWRWLADQVPDADRKATLVHGDIGPGNFLCSAAGEILALIDWELAHIGHPLEDLACVLCRALGVEFGQPTELVRWYGELSNQPVDRSALRYAIVLVLARWSVGINMALSHPTSEQDVPMLITFRQSNQHALLSQIAAHYGLPVPTPPPLESPAGDALYDYLIGNLEETLQAAARDDFVQHRMRGLAQLVRYLRDIDRYGRDRYEAEECDRIEELLGKTFGSLKEARRELAFAAASGGSCEDIALVQHLLWWSAREHSLLTAAMGPMAERSVAW